MAKSGTALKFQSLLLRSARPLSLGDSDGSGRQDKGVTSTAKPKIFSKTKPCILLSPGKYDEEELTSEEMDVMRHFTGYSVLIVGCRFGISEMCILYGIIDHRSADG
jgi:hypothetical protein